ncbi:ribonuclease domain-containing protein [Nocardia jejuensis]|uniref:ribonuclease domain-containing protein n=1 Tax=Nocardia jejuensis TaxID=328049 RepID=UPI0008314403|nr:ribonuclease domain-containing protein [Nocardia jejuensis]
MKVSPKVRAWLLLGVALALVLVAVVASRGGDDRSGETGAKAAATSTASKSTAPKPGGRTQAPDAAEQSVLAPSRVAGVPGKAYDTLVEIDAGRWPGSANAPGTKGGDTWMNRGRDLPTQDSSGKRITYQEWDVNPKRRGQDRDAERIVTGSDGSAWYTGDHYSTFTRMR